MENLVGKEVYYAKYKPRNGEISIFKGVVEKYTISYKLDKNAYGIEELVTNELYNIINSNNGVRIPDIPKGEVFESLENLVEFLKEKL